MPLPRTSDRDRVSLIKRCRNVGPIDRVDVGNGVGSALVALLTPLREKSRRIGRATAFHFFCWTAQDFYAELTPSAATVVLRRRTVAPTIPKPIISISQVAGSGTAPNVATRISKVDPFWML